MDRVAAVAPDWLAARACPDWAERYGRRPYSLPLPASDEGRRQLADQVGRDGLTLLEAAAGSGAPPSLRGLPALEALRRIWVQQFYRDAGGLRWRAEELRWPRPVLPGDVLRVESEVLDLRPSKSQPGRGVIRVRNTTLNQADQPVMVQVVNMIVPRRPS